MNRDDIIRMAQEAGYVYHVSGGTGTYVQFYWDQLEQFAHLVAAAERERIKWDTIHSCHPECDKPVCVAIRKAVAEEREREWQGLTENEIKHLWYEACQTNLELTSQLIVHLARNIEAKLKERNT